MFALSSAPAVVGAARAAWCGIRSCKSAVDNVNRLRRAPEKLRSIADLCSCLLEPLSVAEALASREASLRLVIAAVAFARSAVVACNILLDTFTEEDSWSDWLNSAAKLEQLSRLETRLANAMSALRATPNRRPQACRRPRHCAR